MRSHNVPEHLNKIGNSIRKIWKDTANECGLKIKIHGIPPLSILSFEYGEISQALYTLFTQEMLNRGFLASKAFYATYAHNNEHVNAYELAVKGVFKIIKKAIADNTVMELLHGPVSHTGFKRLA